MVTARSLAWRRAGSVLGKGPGRVVARPLLDAMCAGQRRQCASSPVRYVTDTADRLHPAWDLGALITREIR